VSPERFALWIVLVASLIGLPLFYLTDGTGLGGVLGASFAAAGAGLLHGRDRRDQVKSGTEEQAGDAHG
jgi:hypothetical protein